MKNWRKTTVAEAEAKYPGKPNVPGMEKPFGYINVKWEALKAEMHPGDELYAFRSPPESWQALAGRMGYALVRDGRVVREVVTLLN